MNIYIDHNLETDMGMNTKIDMYMYWILLITYIDMDHEREHAHEY
jgi:hypothetical protein